MSRRATAGRTSDDYVGPLLLAALAITACEGEYRPYHPPQVTSASQPAPNAATAPAGPSVASGPANEGQLIAPSNLGADESAVGVASDDGCAADGSCPPVSLCDADAGACEANCPGCFIGGECVAADAVQPENACLICDPARDARAWSNNDDAPCDDQLFCTIDDVCRAGSCTGSPRKCEDGVACNGVSTCDEASDSCSAPVSQCGTNAVCNVATDTCDSTCSGCVIAGVCVLAGAEAPGNPCQVCDPARSATAFSIASGKSCGSAATACSAQDTCDAQGRCQPNHLPAGSSCGNPASSACDQADACDGSGNCQQRVAANGTPCNDGAFCTTRDQCQGGQCVPSGQMNCGANRTCNEAADQCQCVGCQIGGTCFAIGGRNPTNACQVCDPNRSSTAFSVSVGVSCGSGPTECSGQDTCNAQGQCVPNHLTNGTPCTSVARGNCQSGACVAATLPTGAACQQNSDCSSGRCETWFRDRDGDGFGTTDEVQRICGAQNGSSLPPQGYAANQGDCCDLGGTDAIVTRDIFPGQTRFFDIPQASCPDVNPYDFNCSGGLESVHRDGLGGCAFTGCSNTIVWTGLAPRCGLIGPISTCVGADQQCTAQQESMDVNFCH
jgi:hypothetical protein